jgi:hypothetical protein
VLSGGSPDGAAPCFPRAQLATPSLPGVPGVRAHGLDSATGAAVGRTRHDCRGQFARLGDIGVLQAAGPLKGATPPCNALSEASASVSW